MSEADLDDVRTLRQRIADNPRPALLWIAVAVVLVVLELPRFVAGIGAVASGLVFAIGLFGGLPGYVGGNFENALGSVAGSLAHDGTALLLLFSLAWFLTAFVLGGRIGNRLPDRLGRRRTIWAERLLATAVLAAIAFLIGFTPVGGMVHQELTFWANSLQALSELPSLTSRELIPNMGHRLPGGGWEGTFLGLSPRLSWFIRFVIVWVYAFALISWIWKGYNVYRDHYREADWTPRDDTIERFRNHSWGLFGFTVVAGFVVLATFAPAISPVPYAHNIDEPYNHEFEYLNDDGEVVEVLHGEANLQSHSDQETTVSINSYDPYDRYAPLGTTPRGQDMVAHLAFGARTSLIIALTAILIGAITAIVLSLLTAYYKGVLDIVVILASDTIISVPVLVMAMMVITVFQTADHPLAQPLDGGLLLAIVLGIAYWPGMWRTIRGPSLQVSEQEWVDAAKSYGQKPSAIMRKHMAPYILSYIIIYGSLLIGGIIITVAALSFLGLGVDPPTPEWGRLINEGRGFIWSSSWHISTITGVLIALVVLSFNALGDAIRDSIDPEADIGETTGGGGA